MSIAINTVHNRLDEMMSQLEKSWPVKLQEIMNANPFRRREWVFAYTFTKWDFTGDQPQYNVTHQVRYSMPDPFWGTICRKIYKKGTTELVWCLPHKEGLDNYGFGKIFHDPFIATCIERKKAGALDKMQEEFNKGS